MRDHAGEFPAGGAERIGLASAGFAQPESGWRSIGYRDGAIEADDLTAFAGSLVAEAAQVTMANGAGANGQSGASLVAFIIDFDRLVNAAGGAGDGGMRGAASAAAVGFERSC